MMPLFQLNEPSMTDPDESPAGRQLSAQTLHQRQSEKREQQQDVTAPLVIAFGLHTPENIGSVLRHADAAGCRRLILVDCNVGERMKKITRIARNSDSHLQIDEMSRDELLASCGRLPPLVAVEITSRSTDLYQTSLPEHCALLVGGERHGIDDAMLKHCQAAVHIPMHGINSSMNVSHALTLALFEWRRQHGG